jgi:hypothetical protein
MQISMDAETCAERRVDDARVASLAGSLIDPEEAAALAEMFRLLGDPTRVRILYALLEAGELCVCDIAAVVNTSETKVSQAMRLLRAAGAVRNPTRRAQHLLTGSMMPTYAWCWTCRGEHVAHGKDADT